MEGGSLVKVILSGRRRKSIEYNKITVRPVDIKGELMFQTEFHFDKKVTHMNIPYYEAVDFIASEMRDEFKQANILTETEDVQILASKVEKPRITRSRAVHKAAELSHDRRKKYIIADGVPCNFLIELGVMSPDGKVHKSTIPNSDR